ncbi:MAG: BlaI/MecI/CopY family transcriptional regulator [Luteibaculum sp.]
MELTKAEEQIMKYLWKREQAFVKELLLDFPDPKPAYNTVSTIVRILEKKGFVSHEAFGKTHRYFPLIKQKDYTKASISRVVKGFFKNSNKRLVAHLVEEENLSIQELELLLNELKNKQDG